MSIDSLLDALQAMSVWEVVAVLLGIAYLLLVVRESLWCWYAAFGSTAIFLYIFWDVGLVMESGLQVYYLAMAVYGWWQWQHGSGEAGELEITRWNPTRHVLAIGLVLSAAAISGLLLAKYTGAALPFLDSFTTWGSILTTWMVARKVLENWLYWLVIDSVSIYLYLDRGLYLTALLFMVYLVIVVFGYRKWLHHYRMQSS
ncbi:nicotinamide riboside transporter PnuC [Halioglobus maricola]|uniref:Nicotinamide riboside transporter PnuC n=1 Tax=Halioglobus maricola TaxID=2601894 RepID=A0A5P9NP67_9GAMM|nr:nicotinamide riboside transporter PnuC [Halioglobus maricola]QFU77235.1 nicotinamide riboside transporter PnuC [Halioglobus maricola]